MPAQALEVQRRKRIELEARKSRLKLAGLPKGKQAIPLTETVENLLKDIKAFRKPLTYQKYEQVLGLFLEFVSPKEDVRDIAPGDVKPFLAWRKSKG